MQYFYHQILYFCFQQRLLHTSLEQTSKFEETIEDKNVNNQSKTSSHMS